MPLVHIDDSVRIAREREKATGPLPSPLRTLHILYWWLIGLIVLGGASALIEIAWR